MKKIVLFYSYSGKSKKIAKDIASKENAKIIEVVPLKKRSKFLTYIAGSFEAFTQKAVEIKDLGCNLNIYDEIIIVMPIWASYPAPVINSLIKILPSNKNVQLVMTSGSGNSSRSAEKTKSLITQKGCKVVKYTDIKS